MLNEVRQIVTDRQARIRYIKLLELEEFNIISLLLSHNDLGPEYTGFICFN